MKFNLKFESRLYGSFLEAFFGRRLVVSSESLGDHQYKTGEDHSKDHNVTLVHRGPKRSSEVPGDSASCTVRS